MKIIIDVLGADKGIETVIKGTLFALEENKFIPIFVGPRDIIKNYIPSQLIEKVEIIDANDEIKNSEEPAMAIRRKKNSSIVVGLKHLKEGLADGFFSCGSTGAVLTGATLIVGRISNVDRAALTVVLPGLNKPTILLDVGANMDCSSELLRQFAIMGSCYSKSLFSIPSPKVYLLNVGSEEGKGNKLSKEAYEILNDSNINFSGNIEARNMLNNDADVIVTDGFGGNLVLKTTEGVSIAVMEILKSAISKNLLTKIGGLLIKKSLKNKMKPLDYKEHGAAPMLGAKKPVFKGHGSSDETAVANGIKALIRFIDNNVIEDITKKMEG